MNHREKESVLNIQCLISNLSQLTSNLARRWISGRQTSLACEKPIPTAFPSHRWTGSPRLALWVMAHRQSAVLPDSEPLRSSPVCPLCCLPTGSTFSPSLFTVPWHCSTAHSWCIPAPLCLSWWREERRDRGEQTGKEGEKTQGKNILYKSSTVNVRSADADQPMSVSICNNTRKLHNAPLIISSHFPATRMNRSIMIQCRHISSYWRLADDT